MDSITFITGNQKKADYLAQYLGIEVLHKKLDLDEIQSLDLREVVEHKVRQAYEIVQTPVLVEDTSLQFPVLGKLPGTFIKFFIQELGHEGICDLFGDKDRAAIAETMFAYYDGVKVEFFAGIHRGTIALTPGYDNGFGWDRIFIPDGYTVVRSELPDDDYHAVYLKIKPIEAVKEFLLSL